jgi:Transposase family tnp2
MCDIDDFVTCLLSRPGTETAIQQSGERVRGDIVEDIMSADGVWAIKGPDGVPFLSGGQHNELCFLWALSMDFFNVHHNKIAGKTYPVGCILLSCIQLLPDMRKKTENLCLVSLIPGPHKPSMEEIDHFLQPLIETMKQSWECSAVYRTHNFPHR